MTAEEIEKLKKADAGTDPAEAERIRKLLSGYKRYVEVMLLIPGAAKEEKDDPEGFLERYRLERSFQGEAWPVLDREKAEALNKMAPEESLKLLSETAVHMIRFTNAKIAVRDRLLYRDCVPQHETMKKWRQRQIERSKAVMGTAFDQAVHVPLCFELTDGCSVGCEFCAIGAQKLKSVFRYTPENAKLFDEIMDAAKEMIGPALASAMLYYGSEALDNPDYEKFAAAFLKKTGGRPQVTTAVPLRDRERTHALLKDLVENRGFIHRFSLRSVEEARGVFAEFSPEELLQVELLGQYKESPSFAGFSPAGRAKENGLEETKTAYSICCVSGFVVNMAQKTVRLMTPITPDDRYPSGEVILARESFQDAAEFRTVLAGMIERYMQNGLPRKKALTLYNYFSLAEDSEAGMLLRCPGYTLRVPQGYGSQVLSLLMEGKSTAREIADRTADVTSSDPVEIYGFLHRLWQKGMINEFY